MNKIINRLNKSFYIGVLLKIFLGTFLASYFLSDLFIPFIDYFVSSNFSNPYQNFVEQNKYRAFPYPALMLHIMALPRILFDWKIFNQSIFFKLFISRLPLLIADIGILLVLGSWLKKQFFSKLIWFYWFSPILIYINYIHGQLDVIPIALLFISLYFLFKEKFIISSFFLGLSLATKTNIILVYPFFFLYLTSRKIKIRSLFLFFMISLGTFFIVNLPYIFDSSFIIMVFQNQEQNKIFNSVISLNGFLIYMIPSVLLILFIKGIFIKNYNRDIFIMFLGFNFSILLLFIPPMQGWYFWIIPFLSYFYIQEEDRGIFFLGLQICYILYFIVSKNADYLEVFQFIWPEISKGKIIYTHLSELGIDSNTVVNLVFTMLQTTLLVNCFFIYKRGLDSYSRNKITSSPFLIGIGGNSGVGKTIVSNALQNIFSPQNTTVIRGEDMHKWQRNHEKWKTFTHLDPKANFLHKEIDTLKKLKNGKKLYRRNYDHSTGAFTSEKLLKPNNIIIFEGLHPFYLSHQRNLYDLKIFIKPETELMYHWKIIRDMEKRGYSKHKILKQIKKREKDVKKYIDTQRYYVDILIKPKAIKRIKNIGDKKEKVDLFFKVLLSNSIYIEPLVEALQEIKTIKIEHNYNDNDRQSIVIKGTCDLEKIEIIANDYIPGLEEIGANNPTWTKDCFGILLLLITYYIFESANNNNN